MSDDERRRHGARPVGAAEVRALARRGMATAEIARRLGIGEADVWRLLQAGDCMGRDADTDPA